jgi:alpha-glucoside transport system permease protein
VTLSRKRVVQLVVGAVVLVGLYLLLPDLLSTIVIVVLGLGALLAVLMVLYFLANVLPRKWREGARVTVFLFPALFALLIGLLVPALRTIYLSFFNDSPKPKFVGLKNYEQIFSDKGTRLTVFNTLTWVIIGTVATTVVSLAIARYADGMKGERVAKSLIFVPAAISLAGAGIIWRFVYASPPFKVGFLNQVAKSIPGLPDSMGGSGVRNWFIERGFGGLTPPATAPGFNTLLLIVIFIWAQAGVATIIFSAAIKGVPDSLIEAAKMDGATNKQVFYKVTLPYIRSTIVTVATLVTIAGLKAFDIVASATGGNFGTSTIANDFYTISFLQARFNFASALAVLVFLLVIPVVIINQRAQRRAEEMMAS